MLRRVIRLLRTSLLGLGILSLVWLPISFFTYVWYAASVSETGSWRLSVSEGAAGFLYVSESGLTPTLGVGFETGAPVNWSWAVESAAWPEYERASSTSFLGLDLSIPLWLLALLCLAWPVTSLLLARRRGKG